MAWNDAPQDTDTTGLYGTSPDQIRRKLFPGLELQPTPQPQTWLPPGPAPTPAAAPQPAATPQVSPIPRAAVAPIAPEVPQSAPRPNALAGVVPQAASRPNLQRDVVAGNVVQPQQADYKPEPISKKREILARISAGLIGFRDPQAGVASLERTLDAPKVAAQQAFQNDTNTYDKAMNRGVQAQAANREERNTESEIRYRDAQTAQLGQPKPKEEEWSIVPGVQGPNGEAVQQEKNSGQVRVSPLPGVVPKSPQEKPDTANQDKERYEGIQQAKTLGQPVKPEDAAWAKAYEKASTLGPALNISAQDARGRSFGRNRPVQVLDTWNQNRPITVSAGDAEDNPDRYVNASGGAKALSGQVTMDDIQGAIENVKKTVSVLDKGFVHRAAVATVLADPASTKDTFLQSPVAGQLTSEEQNYVVAVLTAREVVPGLRQIIGTGTATDSRVKNMLQTLPGAQTPNSGYAIKQLDSILGTLKRVRPAIPNVAPNNNPNKPPTTPQAKPGDPLGIF